MAHNGTAARVLSSGAQRGLDDGTCEFLILGHGSVAKTTVICEGV